MSTPTSLFLTAVDAHTDASLTLGKICDLAESGRAIPADQLTTARQQIQRSLAAVNALELLAKGVTPPPQG